jgi:hypothetical protein
MVVRCHGDSCACTASLNGCVWAVSSVPFARFTGCGVSCEKLWKTLTMGGCSKQGIIEELGVALLSISGGLILLLTHFFLNK